jgi:hypothetical protein
MFKHVVTKLDLDLYHPQIYYPQATRLLKHTLYNPLTSMSSTSIILSAAIMTGYGVLWAVLHLTQGKKEPGLLPTRIPFLDPAVGIAREKVNYLVGLRYASSHSLSLPPSSVA